MKRKLRFYKENEKWYADVQEFQKKITKWFSGQIFFWKK